MWLLLPRGALSVVARTRNHDDNPDLELVVRSRRSEWLDAFRDDWCPELTPTEHTPVRDYQYRAYVSRPDLARAMARIALDGISYNNFKSATMTARYGLADRNLRADLHDAYAKTWGTLLSYGDHTSVYDLPVCERFGHYDPRNIGSCRDCGAKMPPPKTSAKRKTTRSFQARRPTAAFLMRAGFLAVWLPLDVRGFRPVLARGWHRHAASHVSARR